MSSDPVPFFGVASGSPNTLPRSPLWTPKEIGESQQKRQAGSSAWDRERSGSSDRSARSPERYHRDEEPRQRTGSIFHSRDDERHVSVDLAEHRMSEGEQAIRDWHAEQIAHFNAKLNILHLEYDAGRYFGMGFGLIGNLVLHLCIKRNGLSTADAGPETFIYGVWMGSIVHHVALAVLFLSLTIWAWIAGNVVAIVFVCLTVLMVAISILVTCVSFSEKRSCTYEGMKHSGGPIDLPPVEHLINAEDMERHFSATQSFRRQSSTKSPDRRQSVTSALREDKQMAHDFAKKKSSSAAELREQLSKFRFSQRLSVVLEEA
jgi:hypothetical protein